MEKNFASNGSRFCTIKEAANRTGLSQTYIRGRCRERTIPVLMCGTKYVVDFPGLLQVLSDEIAGTVSEGEA